MKIKFQGEPSLPELKQAIFEQLQYIEDEFLVHHAKYITLYLTPTNGIGKEIYCQDGTGRKVDKLFCGEPYHSAADDYDNN